MFYHNLWVHLQYRFRRLTNAATFLPGNKKDAWIAFQTMHWYTDNLLIASITRRKIEWSLNLRVLNFLFTVTATIAAIFYICPNFFPFLTPGKRAVANNAYLLRQVLFLMRHKGNGFRFLKNVPLNSFLKPSRYCVLKYKCVCFQYNQVCRCFY